jgi:hypothetical protein
VLHQSRTHYYLFLWAFGSLGVAFASLLTSYLLVDSEPWSRAFPVNGWLIEFGRLLILVLFSVYLLGDVFSRELRMLVAGHPSCSRSIAITRLVAFILAIAEVVILFLYTFFVGPAWLAEVHSVDGAGWRDYLLPYLAYLPYSIVLYLVVFLPVLVVGLFGSLRDLLSLYRKHRNLTDRLHALLLAAIRLRLGENSAPGAGAETSDDQSLLLARHDAINNETFYQFGAFCIDLLYIYGRYAAVILFWSVSIVYEYQIGYQTTLERSRTIGLSAFLVSSGVLVVVSLGYLYYERAYAKTSEVLIENARNSPESQPLQVLDFEERYSIFNFIAKRFLNRHVGIVVALIICLSLPPVSRLIEEIQRVWPG